ncbi:glycosyltransferase family 4 protein [Vibrio fluvialis]|nr:glycosyltransferase family 4 protein [Vibrio fluvialis]
MDNRIVYINGRFLSQRQTGVQKFAFDQTLALSKKFHICVLVPKCVDISNLPKEFNAKNVGRLKGHLWEQVELYVFLKLMKSPDLFTFSGLPPIFYKDSIFTIHDVSFKHNPEWFSLGYRLWYGFAYRILSLVSKKVITVSEFSKNEISKFYPVMRSKIVVVYNRIPLFSSEERVDTHERGEYVLLVSSLDPRKNINNYIEAFTKANSGNYRLIVVGGTGNAFKFNFPKDKLVNVTFTGYVDDSELEELYKGATAFIYPSLYEGFGIPPLEAMSVGCPSIVSNMASIPEVCGDAVLYFDPTSIKSMVDATEKILGDKDLREKISTKGYEQIDIISRRIERYNIIKVANESFTS